MKSKFVLCLSFIQIGGPSFYAPQSVIHLAKNQISEQLQKDYGIEGVFDSDRCADTTNYELFADGIRLNASPTAWSANTFLNYQDLLEGQKINFPIREEFKNKFLAEKTNTAGPSHSRGASMWIAALGVGLLGGCLYYLNTQQSTPQPQTPVIKTIVPVGVVRSF